MRRIERIIPVDHSRNHHPIRRRPRLHNPDLHRRRVSPQHQPPTPPIRPSAHPPIRLCPPPIRQKQRIMRIQRRMVLRKIEREEIHPLVLDLRPDRDREAQAPENVADLGCDPGDRMIGADPPAPARHREVEARRRGQTAGRAARALVERRFERLLDLVHRRAECLPLLGREVGQPAEQRGEGALLPAEHGNPLGIERIGAQRLERREPRQQGVQIGIAGWLHRGTP